MWRGSRNKPSCRQILEDCIERIKSPHIQKSNAFLTLHPSTYNGEDAYFDDLRRRSRESDARWNEGRPLSAVDGMPIAIKDNFCIESWNTSAGSRMLKDFVSPYSSTVCERLIRGGALVVGKTNMDEFGMGSFGTLSHFGPVVLPDTGQVAGGSSSGSAAAVRLGACVAAVGSDTGGSVRLPAAFCGVLGFKPGYGKISRWGLISYASSLDTPGVIGRDIESIVAVTNVIAGPDPRDSTCSTEHWESVNVENSGLEGIRAGILNEFFVEELPAESLRVWKDASMLFPSLKTVSIPSVKHALPVYYVLSSAEASSNLARYDGVQYGYRAETGDLSNLQEEYTKTRTEGFGEEVKRRLLMGYYALSAEFYEGFYCKATDIRAKLRREFDLAFENVDVLIAPVAPLSAPKLADFASHADSSLKDPVEDYLSDFLTVPASLAGLPAIALPGSQSGNQSIQLIAPRGKEDKLLQIARSLHSRLVSK